MVDKPILYARNSRKIPERAIDKVAASINEFGFRAPIVVDKDGVIICGHTRLLAAKKLGLKQQQLYIGDESFYLVVIVQTGLTRVEARPPYERATFRTRAAALLNDLDRTRLSSC